MASSHISIERTSAEFAFVKPLQPETFNSPASRPRLAIACMNCRTRKLKCSWDRPTCSNCALYKVACVYAEGRAKSGPRKKQSKRSGEEPRKSRTPPIRKVSPSAVPVPAILERVGAWNAFENYLSTRREQPPWDGRTSTFELGQGEVPASTFAGVRGGDMSQAKLLRNESIHEQ
ncbi:hypothetical protein EXIGLDRAFT_699675 [Exidia glandulosa HHB12029]|uniref:Zn(2)-C6 fungal-type domain-containing protein n=1 Tax=Exidia glandulosa HHB12029 TaxID=1314781 RepID=A0A165DS55_EXIGL|nr:hypothetical protein EXIGLDRAFT_699675 [Exidia glandulosa HHB12029]